MLSWATHWNGVCAFGTKVETLTLKPGVPSPSAFTAWRSLKTRADISSTSASVSVGSPIMK